LETLADLATIRTAVIAAYAYGNYRLVLKCHTRKLETALAGKTQPNDDSVALSQLAISLTLTEPQVVEAASRSSKIETWAGHSGTEYRFRIKRKSN
ncbi:MAG: hypothetical protein ACRED2_06620, partial [Methylocella sp.]